MKNIKSLFAVVLLFAVVTVNLHAQFDTFKAPRTLILEAPTKLAAASTLTLTNDLVGFIGTARIDLFCHTNSSAGTVTALVETSPDSLTWTALTYANATATSIIYTNASLGNATNVYFTDTFLLPGSFTTPTSYSAGFVTPYITYNPMTNVAALALTGINYKSIGFSATDAYRYLRITFTAAGAVESNAWVGATLTGCRAMDVK